MRTLAVFVLLATNVVGADSRQDPPAKEKPRCRIVVAGESAQKFEARSADSAATISREWEGDGTRVIKTRDGSVTVTHRTEAYVDQSPPPIPIERNGRRDVLKKEDLFNKDGWT